MTHDDNQPSPTPEQRQRFEELFSESWQRQLTASEMREQFRLSVLAPTFVDRLVIAHYLGLIHGTKDAARTQYDLAGYQDMPEQLLKAALKELEADPKVKSFMTSQALFQQVATMSSHYSRSHDPG